MFTILKRIILSGLKTFWRNGFLSSSSILTLTITLVIAGIFYFTIILGDFTLKKVQDKVDINIYFTTDAPFDKVVRFQQELIALPEVDKERTKLLTKEEALDDLLKQNEGKNSFINEAVKVIGENPLGAVLNLKAKNIDAYSNILSFLGSHEMQAKYLDIIENTNYNENGYVIKRIKIWLKYINIIAIVVLAIFALISIIIIYNTIRLIIYSYREEIQVMRLIGASKFFTRGPFLIEAILYGLISGIFATFILWALIYFSTETIGQLTPMNLNQFFSDNILKIFIAYITTGIIISFTSTFFAVAKYLKAEELN